MNPRLCVSLPTTRFIGERFGITSAAPNANIPQTCHAPSPRFMRNFAGFCFEGRTRVPRTMRTHFRPGPDSRGRWLAVFQLFIAEEFSRNLVGAAFIVLAMGAHWLWTNYIP